MKRISRLPWWLRLICILAVIQAAGMGLNALYRWHINRRLMVATEHADIDEISRRIAEGADVNLPITDKQTNPTPATYLASELRRKNKRPNKPHTTLLMVAVASKHLDVARQLLAHGARVDDRDEYGFTALTMAISVKCPEIVELLLDHHADPNAAGDINMPPLTWALLLRQNEIARLLLHAGADPNVLNRDGLPPLYLAVMDDNVDAVRALLAAGADANVKYHDYPAFRTAVEQGNPSIVMTLLRFGADVNAVYADGRTPLELARNARQHDLAELLVHAGAMK
jgi:ankyrin repeat protein